MPENIVGRVCAPGEIDFIRRSVKPPKAGEVLIKIKASCICGSDLHIYRGKHPSVSLPCTVGHEFSGDVAEVGEGVTGVKPGDRVTAEPVIPCGKCEACRTGNYGYCENISYTYRNGDGAMADYITVKEPYVYRLPEWLSYESGALVEPLAVAVHAVKRAEVSLGESVIVFGAGAIGILVAALCGLSGAATVAVADLSQPRLDNAKAFGATHTINSAAENLAEAAREITGGRGFDKSFECVGVEATFRQAMESLRKNGLATMVGIFETPEISIPVTRFVTHEIRVQGAQGYCWDFQTALTVSGRIPLEKLITHRFQKSELKQAFETCLDRNSQAVKVAILM